MRILYDVFYLLEVLQLTCTTREREVCGLSHCNFSARSEIGNTPILFVGAVAYIVEIKFIVLAPVSNLCTFSQRR